MAAYLAWSHQLTGRWIKPLVLIRLTRKNSSVAQSMSRRFSCSSLAMDGAIRWNERGMNSNYSAFCEDLWDLQRETFWRKEMDWVQSCWSRRFHLFSPRYLSTFVGFFCFAVALGLFLSLAFEVPGSFANSCKYSLTLRASLINNAWS